MSMMESLKIIGTTLYSILGGGAIIFALSSWLGKVWANRILEKDKIKYSLEIEELKNKFNKELEYYKSQIELTKIALSRYSESQFHLYNKLWFSLVELKISGDKLWSNVDENTVLDFAVKVRRATEEVYKNALLIEKNHKDELDKILLEFSNYFIGKYRLIELDKKRPDAQQILGVLGHALTRGKIIQENSARKEAYEKLLSSIENSFRNQMKSGLQS